MYHSIATGSQSSGFLRGITEGRILVCGATTPDSRTASTVMEKSGEEVSRLSRVLFDQFDVACLSACLAKTKCCFRPHEVDNGKLFNSLFFNLHRSKKKQRYGQHAPEAVTAVVRLPG